MKMKMSPPLRALLIATGAGLLVLLPHRPAFAGQPIDPATLVPVPPSIYTCQADGVNTICRENQTYSDPPAPSGFLCGSSANPVELVAQDTNTQQATRYYNAAGFLTRREIHDDFQGTLTNPLNGALANFTQKDTLHDVLAVPGNLTTVTDTSTGVYRIDVPGQGTVFQSSGRLVLAPDGTEVSVSGQHNIDNYYAGDTAVIQKLCTVLGAPQTP